MDDSNIEFKPLEAQVEPQDQLPTNSKVLKRVLPDRNKRKAELVYGKPPPLKKERAVKAAFNSTVNLPVFQPESRLACLTIDQLKTLLKQYGEPTTGKKMVLQQRLIKIQGEKYSVSELAKKETEVVRCTPSNSDLFFSNDVLGQIFRFLPIKDLALTAHACKVFQYLITLSPDAILPSSLNEKLCVGCRDLFPRFSKWSGVVLARTLEKCACCTWFKNTLFKDPAQAEARWWFGCNAVRNPVLAPVRCEEE